MLRQLRRASFDRGLLGGSRWWVAVGVLLWAARGLRLATRRQGGVAWRGVLAEGETISIRAVPGGRRRGGRGGSGA